MRAATDNWNSDAPSWPIGTGWDLGFAPTTTDIASFNPDYHSSTYIVSHPDIPGIELAQALELNNNFLGGTFDFTNAGMVQLHGGPMTVRGFGTYSFLDPQLDAGGSYLDIGTDAELTLENHSLVTNLKAVFLYGGTLTLDDSTGYVPRLPSTTPIQVAGGTLAVLGNSSVSTTYSLGQLISGPGFNSVSLTASGTPQALQFGNPGSFSLRNNTYMALRFLALGGGTLGGVGPLDAKINFTGIPNTGPGVGPPGARLLSHTAGGLDVGFATTTDASGTTYAAWEPSLGVVPALPTLTTTTGPGLAASTPSDFTQFNAPAATTSAASAIIAAVLRITTSGSGGSLDLSSGPFNISTHGVMLDGNDNFHIHGSPGAVIGSPTTNAPIYYYINNLHVVLGTDMIIGNQSGSTNIVGPGFLELTGAKQNVLNNSSDHRLNLLGGVLRATDASIDFTAGLGTIALRGGVLEIQKGLNGDPTSGGTADFNRKLDYNNSFGTLNWSSVDPGDNLGGSGGFSAYTSNASVNIGGSLTPTTLTWNAAGFGFVMDGYALAFGSVQSTNTLTWYNPIDLGTNTNVTGTISYAAREFQVTQGTGTALDKTVIAGVISGPPSTDLIKNGSGTLELAAKNTYEGGTIIEKGTLRAANPGGPSLGSTRQIIINSQGTLLYGADNQVNNPTTPVTMVGPSAGGGSTLNVDGHSEGTALLNGLGTLTLSGNSTLDLGVTPSSALNTIVHFDKSSAQPWTGTLSIWNWTGTPVTGGGTDQVYFGFSTSGLTAAQLTQISFYSDSGTTFLGTAVWATPLDGEVTTGAVPEPTAIFGALGLLGLIGRREWRRRHEIKTKPGAGRGRNSPPLPPAEHPTFSLSFHRQQP